VGEELHVLLGLGRFCLSFRAQELELHWRWVSLLGWVKVESGFSQTLPESPKWHEDKANEAGRSLVPWQHANSPIPFMSWLGYWCGEGGYRLQPDIHFRNR